MLGGGSGSSSEKASVTTPELDGLVQRTIHGTLPYGDKQAFISEVVRDFQNVADADRAAFLKDAAQRLVQQEIDSTNRSEPTPAEISRLEDFYEGMVAGLEAAAGLGLGGGGGSSLVDLFA